MFANRTQPKVSVIVPVYNVERYLEQCLDSLIDQTLKDIEIICINDASTDGSLSILKRYAKKDDRIVLINLKENKRQGGARNAGIKIAKGEYLGFVDSDDWVSPNMYENLWNASQNGTIDLVCSDYNTYKEKEKEIIITENIPGSVFSLAIKDQYRHFILHGGRIWTNIFKRELILDNNLLFPEKLIYEDNAIMPALYCSAKTTAKVNRALYYYRLNNTSTTGSKDNIRFFDRLETSVTYLEHMKRLGLYDQYKEEIEYHFYELYYYTSLLGCFFRFSTVQRKQINYIKNNFSKHVRLSGNHYYREKKKGSRDAFLKLVQWNTEAGIFMFHLLNIIKKK